jgi:hypothetical protein
MPELVAFGPVNVKFGDGFYRTERGSAGMLESTSDIIDASIRRYRARFCKGQRSVNHFDSALDA